MTHSLNAARDVLRPEPHPGWLELLWPNIFIAGGAFTFSFPIWLRLLMATLGGVGVGLWMNAYYAHRKDALREDLKRLKCDP